MKVPKASQDHKMVGNQKVIMNSRIDRVIDIIIVLNIDSTLTFDGIVDYTSLTHKRQRPLRFLA